MSLYLGIDCSTQSISAIIIDSQQAEIILEESISFESDLPEYQHKSGFIEGEKNGEFFADPKIWLDGLELLFNKLKKSIALNSIDGISGSAQQHATVYLKNSFPEILKSLDPALQLSQQIEFSRKLSNIWMDCSTSEEIEEILCALSDDYIKHSTGSCATRRFCAAQIKKFAKTDPIAYQETNRIHLLSSFLTSILMGKDAPIEAGDGAGMNLMDLDNFSWDSKILSVIAPTLKNKLPLISSDNGFIQKISSFFVHRYDFNPHCQVLSFTGDNPSSLVGIGASIEGIGSISLGTSDTFFTSMTVKKEDPNNYGHVFGNPSSNYMSLTCFSNGSLARENFKEKTNLSWSQISDKILSSSLENQPHNIKDALLPFVYPEATPPFSAGVIYNNQLIQNYSAFDQLKLLIECQFLNMFIHSQWCREDNLNTLRLTGGASQNDGIVQIIADIFNYKVERINITNSAALGGAFRILQKIKDIHWKDIFSEYLKLESKTIYPNEKKYRLYREKKEAFKKLVDKKLSIPFLKENLTLDYLKKTDK